LRKLRGLADLLADPAKPFETLGNVAHQTVGCDRPAGWVVAGIHEFVMKLGDVGINQISANERVTRYNLAKEGFEYRWRPFSVSNASEHASLALILKRGQKVDY
jgi:hypothetical protein